MATKGAAAEVAVDDIDIETTGATGEAEAVVVRESVRRPSQTPIEVEDMPDEYNGLHERDADGWNGKATRLSLAYPVVRDNILFKEGAQIIVAASLSDGRWRGPEADHVVDLLQRGIIKGVTAKQRAARQAVIDTERGVYPDAMEPDFVPIPGLQERTGEDTEWLLRRMLAGGPDAMLAREKAELKDAMREMQEQMTDFAKIMTQAMSTMAAGVQAQAGLPPISPREDDL